MNFCPNCGEKILSSGNYCQKCGINTTEINADVNPRKTQSVQDQFTNLSLNKVRFQKNWISAILLIVSIFLYIFYVVQFFSGIFGFLLAIREVEKVEEFVIDKDELTIKELGNYKLIQNIVAVLHLISTIAAVVNGNLIDALLRGNW
jgi:uncharacterized membrane protein YvbJ